MTIHRARRPATFEALADPPPARAPAPLLPDAGLARGVRGPRPGDLPARLAAARDLRGALDLRAWLYRIATNACLDALQRRPRRPHGGEVPWLQPYPGRAARGHRRARCGARRPGRRQGDDRAGLHGRDPAPAAEDARGADPARRARLARQGHRGAARDERRGGQQRAPAGARRPQGAPARAPARMGAGRRSHARPSASCSTATSRPANAPTPTPSPRSCARTRRGRCRRSPASGAGATRSWRPGSRAAWAPRVRPLPLPADVRQPPARRRLLPARPGESDYRALALDVLRIEEGEIADITSFTSAVFPAFGLPAEALMRFDRRDRLRAARRRTRLRRGGLARRAGPRRPRRDQ